MLPDETDSKREQAEDTLGEGLELLDQGLEEEAGRLFFQSTEIDPTYADGYVHLGNIAWRKDDWKQAEALYRKALDCAQIEVKGIPRGHFWGILESRPYMRAMHGLGLTAWKQGKLPEAVDIFQRMLKLNPNDNQGARYLLGPVYHEMGDFDEAARWYRRTGDDPQSRYNYGLALIQQNETEKAATVLIFAVFANPYVAPILLGRKLPRRDWWHGTSWAEPESAIEYSNDYGAWWQKEKLPLAILDAIWTHTEVQQRLTDFIATRRAMKRAKAPDDRVSLGVAGDSLITRKWAKRVAASISKLFETE
jgi:tetratricopeptide (TPR) repeat protein